MEIPRSFSDYRETDVRGTAIANAMDILRAKDAQSYDWALDLLKSWPAYGQLLLANLAYEDSGQVTYALSKYLQDEFAEAVFPKDIDPSDLRLPSSSIWIALPGNEKTLYGGPGAGNCKVHGMYLYDHEAAIPGGRPGYLGVVAWGPPTQAGSDFDDACAGQGIPLSECRDLESFLKVREERNLMVIDSRPDDVEYPEEQRLHNLGVLTELSRMALMMILHINMKRRWVVERALPLGKEREALEAEAKRKSGKKAAKLLRRAGRMTRINYLVLDAPPEAKAARAAKPGARSGSPSHWRPQHLRRVWSGPRTDENGNPQKGTSYEWKTIPGTWVRGHGTLKDAEPAKTITVVKRHDERQD